MSLGKTFSIYENKRRKRVNAIKMARYVMITPNPEDDVSAYLDNWARRSGLLEFQPDAMRIGWDFPYVTPELKNRFGLWGYVAAYILPEGFETSCPGVEFAFQKQTVLRIFLRIDRQRQNGIWKEKENGTGTTADSHNLWSGMYCNDYRQGYQ